MEDRSQLYGKVIYAGVIIACWLADRVISIVNWRRNNNPKGK